MATPPDAQPTLLIPTPDEMEWQRQDLVDRERRAAEKAERSRLSAERAPVSAAVTAIARYLRTLDSYDPDDDCLPFDQEDVLGVPVWRPVPTVATELHGLAHGGRP